MTITQGPTSLSGLALMKIHDFFHQASCSICQRGSPHLPPIPRSGSHNPLHRLPVLTVLSTEMTVDQTYLEQSARKLEVPEKHGTYLDVNTVLTEKAQAKSRLNSD